MGEALDCHRRQSVMSAPGDHAALYEGLPRDVGDLARVLHGLLLHEHVAPAYGVAIPEPRRAEVHVRRVRDRLAVLHERDARPLSVARPPPERMIANCRHYALQLASLLRDQGVPARARCGFGSYFEPGRYVDHWVCEVWSDETTRWVLVDAQLDELQRSFFRIDFDPLHVPRDRFLVAGEAWQACRAGTLDPEAFGILDMHGPWFVAGNLVRDLAALNGMEMLPWDVWGAMPGPDGPLDGERLAALDDLAALTVDPDATFERLRARYASDPAVRVPPIVWNSVLGRSEPV